MLSPDAILINRCREIGIHPMKKKTISGMKFDNEFEQLSKKKVN
jgi:hypothetical protein